VDHPLKGGVTVASACEKRSRATPASAPAEGEIDLSVGWQRDRVVVHLGEPVSWFSLTPQHARQLAASLAQHAHALDGRGPALAALIEAY
jgi:hypothetical protein